MLYTTLNYTYQNTHFFVLNHILYLFDIQIVIILAFKDFHSLFTDRVAIAPNYKLVFRDLNQPKVIMQQENMNIIMKREIGENLFHSFCKHDSSYSDIDDLRPASCNSLLSDTCTDRQISKVQRLPLIPSRIDRYAFNCRVCRNLQRWNA